MEDEYDYLRKEALRFAKAGRQKLPEAERRFHEAAYRVRHQLTLMGARDLEKIFDDIMTYPRAIRAVMDDEDRSRDMLLRAIHIKRVESFAASLAEKEPTK